MACRPGHRFQRLCLCCHATRQRQHAGRVLRPSLPRRSSDDQHHCWSKHGGAARGLRLPYHRAGKPAAASWLARERKTPPFCHAADSVLCLVSGTGPQGRARTHAPARTNHSRRTANYVPLLDGSGVRACVRTKAVPLPPAEHHCSTTIQWPPHEGVEEVGWLAARSAGCSGGRSVGWLSWLGGQPCRVKRTINHALFLALRRSSLSRVHRTATTVRSFSASDPLSLCQTVPPPRQWRR